ncbi:MAG: glutamyl-tRNA reductase [Chlamydiae bacterium]|nr:glutamyl-tRNA reductase [Chlamydiota bacterium]
MQVGVLGINYKSSELNVREILAKKVLCQIADQCWLDHKFSYVLVSTCNRTEIYFSSEDLTATHTQLINLLRIGIDFSFEHSLYSFFGTECFSHLAKVAAGFDSVIFGEAEIQRQIKKSYETAAVCQKLPSCMHYMFQKALRIGKKMRTQFNLPRNKASIESVLLDLCHSFFKHKSPSILFLGNSDINRLIMNSFSMKGFDQITLATRSLQSAQSLVEKMQINLMPWDKIATWTEYDMVICGSNQKDYIINKEDVYKYAEPVSVMPSSLIIDLSMPRSVDPVLSKHPQISLFNIEEINYFVNKKQRMSLVEREVMKSSIQDAISLQLTLYQEKQRKICSYDFSSL